MTITFGTYTFPNYLADWEDNFSELETRAMRLPGLDGGFNNDGDEPSPTQIGRVTLALTIISDTRAGMDALRDAASALASSGVQKLTHDPLEPTAANRWCFAKIKEINMPEKLDEHTDLWQRVKIEFLVADPHWYVTNKWPWEIGDGSIIGSGGLTIGSGAASIVAAGASTSSTITQNGNTYAVPMVSILPGAGNTCENPKVQRLVDGAVVDEIAYTGVLGATDEIYVDGRTQLATLNADSLFGDDFSFMHPDFMRLAPGVNTIRILMKNAGDDATIRMWFNDTFR